jgi:hypothetical protein
MPDKTPSGLLSELAQRSKGAEESAAAERAKNRAALEARRDAIETSIDQSKAELAGNAEDAKSKWGQMSERSGVRRRASAHKSVSHPPSGASPRSASARSRSK